MDRELYEQLKSEALQLPLVSEQALQAFEQSFTKLLVLVNERFAVETKFLHAELSEEQVKLIKDMHKCFGELLLGVYEFQLYQNLIDEFCWFISVLSSRSLGREYLEKVIKTWNIAIHSLITPPASHALVRPLEWLYQNLPSLYEHKKPPEEHKADELQRFLALLKQKKRKAAAEYLLSLLEQNFTIEKLFSDILPQALKEIGILWQTKEISVVDVHVATDICRYIMFRLIDSINAEPPLSYKALVACVPGEEHEMGAEIVENYLEMKGWKVHFMGHIAPLEDILKTIQTTKPNVVFLSVSMIANLPAAKALALKIRETMPEVKILIGGHAAMLAREGLKYFCDAIADSINEVHKISLSLVNPYA
jgi:methanogenic corrinoid protein MtbC1